MSKVQALSGGASVGYGLGHFAREGEGAVVGGVRFVRHPLTPVMRVTTLRLHEVVLAPPLRLDQR